MLKSISNIAWPQENEEWVLKELQRRKWNAIEVAPSRIWEDFRKISGQERKKYREKILEHDLKICSMHSLFWGMKEAKVFGTAAEQKFFQDYMKELVELAADLGSRVLVMGSPPVRDREGLEYSEAVDIAASVLREPAEYAVQNNVAILIEPLTKKETNFINTHSEGLELARAVDSEGFGLHLDAKSVASEGVDVTDAIFACNGHIRHFHVNDPNLQPIGTVADYHEKMGKALRQIEYAGYVSIEMKMTDNYQASILQSMDVVDLYY